MMGKNLLFLLLCVLLTGLVWLGFQFLGQHAFSVMLLITVVLLIAKAGKARFGKK